MPDLHIRIQMLCAEICKEQDQDSLIALVRELNQLMEERAKRATEPSRKAKTA